MRGVHRRRSLVVPEFEVVGVGLESKSGPDSSSSTDRLGSSVRRAASTHPADPAPIITTSYFIAHTLLIFRLRLERPTRDWWALFNAEMLPSIFRDCLLVKFAGGMIGSPYTAMEARLCHSEAMTGSH